ncbi:hypothetical protein NDU88_001910 [Pleurodeles waltl]|uniref:Uncharacterized protein n=1 Tax=Pleurodeles waltl TaxID=8319 RepID=A0AAV7TKB7_PLEWA|nr:hypothetical protein NDU88_001910 [Pleurodeles waltl]
MDPLASFTSICPGLCVDAAPQGPRMNVGQATTQTMDWNKVVFLTAKQSTRYVFSIRNRLALQHHKLLFNSRQRNGV